MARPLRIEYPGALYHVTSRGNARQPIFVDDGDRQVFIRHLGAVVEAHRWLLYAYCLMTNHYHLLVETPEPDLSRGMRRLNGHYCQTFNRRHRRVGHVLQGRFSGILVERESHLLELARYIVLNPVRAGMTEAPETFPWSSLQAAIGVAAAPPWLVKSDLLARFGSAERYLAFVREGIGRESPWSGVRGFVLGSERFVDRLAGLLGGARAQSEFPRRERLAHREALDALLPQGAPAGRAERNRRIREAVRSGRYTAAEIGRHTGLHYSTISRILAATAAE